MSHQIRMMKKRLLMREAPEILRQNCLVYMESGHNKQANQIVLDNIDYIRERVAMMEKDFDCFGEKPTEFIYLPDLAASYEEAIRYYVPALDASSALPQLQTNAIAKEKDWKNLPPCFFRYEEWLTDESTEWMAMPVFSVHTFWCDDVADGRSMLEDLFNRFERLDEQQAEQPEMPMAMAALNTESTEPGGFDWLKDKRQNEQPEEDTEQIIATFDAETRRLMQEVKEKAERLRLNGVSEWIIQRLVLPSEKLSRLVVTCDFRIILPDYNDMEIKMEPLVKSVYILFLEHEEGIRFKCLSDYRQRLAYIYNKVLEHSALTRTITPERKEESLSKVVDPLSNSINEKCARIKAAFLSMFDEHLANRYYIVGKSGGQKRISLPRNLIELQYHID